MNPHRVRQLLPSLGAGSLWAMLGRALLVSVATTVVRVLVTHSLRKKR